MEFYGRFLKQREKNAQLFDECFKTFGLLASFHLDKVLHFRIMLSLDKRRQFNRVKPENSSASVRKIVLF
jgi:hypothetical protein